MTYGEEMRFPRSSHRAASRGTRFAGLAVVAASFAIAAAGCGTSRRAADDTLAEPVGPRDPFDPASAAVIWPGASDALLLSEPLRASSGTFAVSWTGEFEGEPMPAGRFGRPRAGSPVVVWFARGKRAAWRATFAPVPVEDGDRTRLAASVEITVRPLSPGQGRARLVATVSPDSAFPVPATDEATPVALAWRRSAAGVPPALGPASSAGATSTLVASATSARPARWRFLVAGSPRVAGRLGALAHRSHATLAAEVERAWSLTLATSASLTTGDPALEQAVDEALLVLVGCTERDGGRLRAVGNPFHYRDTWIRDAARQVSALSQWGLAEPAHAIAADLLAFQSEAGDLMSQPGQLDGTGQAMWAQRELYSRDGPHAPPDSVLRALARAWRWCEAERALVRQLAPAFAGLMPPADPRDNELATGYLFGTDAWTLAGYRAAASLLEQGGEHATAESLRVASAAYAAEISTRVARGRGAVPACWSGPARDWGNFAALVPTGALSPAEAGRAGLLSRLHPEGAQAGLARYGAPDSVHLYLGSDLAVDALLMGRAELWRAALRSTLGARTATGGMPEIFCSTTHGYGWNLPPHTAAAAALLTLIRQALVFDALGDTLRLSLGTLPEWWVAGTNLKRAPTRWGVVDLSFRQEGDTARWDWTPVPVPVEVTLPPGMHVAANPGGGQVKGAHRLLVPSGTGHLEVTCARD